MSIDQPTQNPTPDATATPRKAQRFSLVSWLSIYGRACHMYFVKESDYVILEMELTAAKAEIATAQRDISVLAADKLLYKARAETAEAESAQLRAEVEQIANILPKTGHDTVGAARDIMQDVAELRARVAELEQDKARLDWLEHSEEMNRQAPYFCNGSWCLNGDEAHPSVRAAIDAARAGKGAT